MADEPLPDGLKYPDDMADDIIPMDFEIDFDRRPTPPPPAEPVAQNEESQEARNERLF